MAKSRSGVRVLAITSVSHLINHFSGSIIAVFSALIIEELGLNLTEWGLIVGISTALAGFLQLFFGVLSLRVSKRILLAIGNFVTGATSVAMGYAQGAVDFASYRITQAFGTSPQHPVGSALISEYFEESRSSAIGTHFSIAYVGNIAGPVAAAILVVPLGWRIALVVLSVPTFISGLSILALTKGETFKRKDTQPTQDRRNLTRQIVKAIKNKNVLGATLVQTLVIGGTGFGFLTNYIPLYLTQDLRLDVVLMGLVYTSMLLGAILGPLIFGRVSDRYGRKKTLLGLISCSVLSMLVLIVIAPYGVPVVATMLFFIGLFCFPITTVMQTIVADATDNTTRNVAMGVFFAVGQGCSSLWMILVGILADTYQSFIPSILLMAILALASTLIVIFTITEQNHRSRLEYQTTILEER